MTKFKYSNQKHNLSKAFVRVVYEDGSTVEPLSKNYNGLNRKGMKSVTVVIDGKPFYTLPIVNDKLIFRMRNLARGLAMGNAKSMNFANPKRCFILATEGKIVFVWDSEEVKELKDWDETQAMYSKPNLREDEK